MVAVRTLPRAPVVAGAPPCRSRRWSRKPRPATPEPTPLRRHPPSAHPSVTISRYFGAPRPPRATPPQSSPEISAFISATAADRSGEMKDQPSNVRESRYSPLKTPLPYIRRPPLRPPSVDHTQPHQKNADISGAQPRTAAPTAARTLPPGPSHSLDAPHRSPGCSPGTTAAPPALSAFRDHHSNARDPRSLRLWRPSPGGRKGHQRRKDLEQPRHPPAGGFLSLCASTHTGDRQAARNPATHGCGASQLTLPLHRPGVGGSRRRQKRNQPTRRNQ